MVDTPKQDPIDAWIERKLAGSTRTPTPADQWTDWMDPRTGEVIGIRDPKLGTTKLYPKQTNGAQTITTADGRTMQWNPDTNRYDIEIGAKSPTVSAGASDQFILTRQPDGSLKQEPNPNYRPPQGRPPQKTAKQIHDEEFAKLEAAGEFLKWKRDNGYEVSAKELQELKQKGDQLLQDMQAAAAMERQTQQQAYDLPFKQAEQQRADQTLQLQQRQSQGNTLMKRAEAGQALLDKAVGLGIAPSREAINELYFDPHRRALDLLGQAMTAPTFDPHTRALDLIGQQQAAAQNFSGQATVAPSVYPPQAPSVNAGPPPAPSVAGFLPPPAPSIR